MNPLDYSLCGKVVTLYRKQGETVIRQVVEGCYLACRQGSSTEIYGKSRLKQFLLIIPGDHPLQCGDRIYDGVGPENVDWQQFLPATVPEVYEAGYVRPCFWEGRIAHWEAGAERRWQ